MGTRIRHTTKIGKRNTVTIPAATLRRAGLKPGDRIDVIEEEDGGIRLETVRQWIERTAGMLYRPGTPVLADEELEAEIRRAHQVAADESHRRFLAREDNQ